MKLKEVSDIPKDWKVLDVRKNSTVKIRPSNGVETFKVSWQEAELVSDPEVDLIVIQPNGKEYPCKRDIFWQTYAVHNAPDFYSEDVSLSVYDYEYVKNAKTRIVQIPEGVNVEIETLEGILPVVTFPDYVAIGVKGELYANTQDFVQKNLEIL